MAGDEVEALLSDVGVGLDAMDGRVVDEFDGSGAADGTTLILTVILESA